MRFEYKAVGAPERGRKKKGAKTRSDRAAAAFEELLQANAVDGWEYLRTDLIPVEERPGMFSRVRESHRAVMVFRRALPDPREAAPTGARIVRPTPVAAPAAVAEPAPAPAPEPAHAAPEAPASGGETEAEAWVPPRKEPDPEVQPRKVGPAAKPSSKSEYRAFLKPRRVRED
ncbi:MAG: DUF4177 domain-containing protein [Pseudomonadota bacterium]